MHSGGFLNKPFIQILRAENLGQNVPCTYRPLRSQLNGVRQRLRDLGGSSIETGLAFNVFDPHFFQRFAEHGWDPGVNTHWEIGTCDPIRESVKHVLSVEQTPTLLRFVDAQFRSSAKNNLILNDLATPSLGYAADALAVQLSGGGVIDTAVKLHPPYRNAGWTKATWLNIQKTAGSHHLLTEVGLDKQQECGNGIAIVVRLRPSGAASFQDYRKVVLQRQQGLLPIAVSLNDIPEGLFDFEIEIRARGNFSCDHAILRLPRVMQTEARSGDLSVETSRIVNHNQQELVFGDLSNPSLGSVSAVGQTQLSGGGSVSSGYFAHPPYLGQSFTELRFAEYKVPAQGLKAILKADLGLSAGSECGDGVEVEWLVEDGDQNRVSLKRLALNRSTGAHTITADLSDFAFRNVVPQLRVHSKANANCDHLIISDPRILLSR
jgi:hypothetical protein